METINGTDEICDTTPNSDALPGPAQNALAFAHRYITHREVFSVQCPMWPKILHSDRTLYTVYHSHFSHRLHTNNAKNIYFSVFLKHRCIPLFLCLSIIVKSLCSLLLSCFSSLGNSLRHVGSALSDRDVITSPDYYGIKTTQTNNVEA